MAHDGHHHHHGHAEQTSPSRTANLRAAYIHVMAGWRRRRCSPIAALLIAMVAQWVWADPAVGIIGQPGVIASWAYGLIRDSGAGAARRQRRTRILKAVIP